MKIGYARVNTSYQNLALQIEPLQQAVYAAETLYREGELTVDKIADPIGISLGRPSQARQQAIDDISVHLTTPLQINQYLNLALTETYRSGITPVTEDLVKTVLAYDLNSMEAWMVRQGYDAKLLSETLDIRTKDVHSFIKGELSGSHRDEIVEGMQSLGIVL